MIHDIDMILGLVGSPVVSVQAVGTSIFSRSVDLANARVGFASGCVATVTASRVSHKVERSLRIFQPSSYVVCDFGAGRIISTVSDGELPVQGTAGIATTVLDVASEDSLGNEINEFLTCVLERRRPSVDGRIGQEAIEVASRINESIIEHHQLVEANGRVGQTARCSR
jgi:predicted dehydrogenase